jgi:N-acetylglucosaminyldiphosphoundecaprenol N-acetyl-beta-D-mannosaminyltransferase
MHTSLRAQPRPPVNILDVGVHALDLPGAVCTVEGVILAGTQGYVCVTSAHGIMEAQRDAEFQKILNHAFLMTPDGTPTVCGGRIQGREQMKRVFGPDLMLGTFLSPSGSSMQSNRPTLCGLV